MRVRVEPEQGESFEPLDLKGLLECALVGWSRPAGPGKLTHSWYCDQDGNPLFLRGLLHILEEEMGAGFIASALQRKLDEPSLHSE